MKSTTHIRILRGGTDGGVRAPDRRGWPHDRESRLVDTPTDQFTQQAPSVRVECKAAMHRHSVVLRDGGALVHRSWPGPTASPAHRPCVDQGTWRHMGCINE